MKSGKIFKKGPLVSEVEVAPGHYRRRYKKVLDIEAMEKPKKDAEAKRKAEAEAEAKRKAEAQAEAKRKADEAKKKPKVIDNFKPKKTRTTKKKTTSSKE